MSTKVQNSGFSGKFANDFEGDEIYKTSVITQEQDYSWMAQIVIKDEDYGLSYFIEMACRFLITEPTTHETYRDREEWLNYYKEKLESITLPTEKLKTESAINEYQRLLEEQAISLGIAAPK